MKLVIIPNLISLGTKIVLAIRSPDNKKTAPIKAEIGITSLLSGPTINLVICGIIIPTKASIPHTATETEVISVAKTKNINLFNSTFKPNVFAESSDKDKIFILFEKIKNRGISAMIIGAAI